MIDSNNLYYSYKLRRNLAEASVRVPPGAAHYSYSSVCDKFLRIFQEHGVFARELERPEVHAEPPHASQGRAKHLIFKPFEEFRVLHGAYNIAHVAWEFEELPSKEGWLIGDPRRRDPFADHAHMLRIPQQIWVASCFAQRVFNRYGIHSVEVVPAPIHVQALGLKTFFDTKTFRKEAASRRIARLYAIRLTSRLLRTFEAIDIQDHTVPLSSIMHDGRDIFLHVANPGDLRKNLPALIDGFSLLGSRGRGAALILKLTIDNVFVNMKEVLSEILPRLYDQQENYMGDIAPDNIFIVHDFITDDELHSLYDVADFYVTAAIAEGQNLPLQEAMAAGVIPVAPDHTAMADYINANNAVMIDWRLGTGNYALEHAYGIRNVEVPVIGATDICRALEVATSLSNSERLTKQELAWHTIVETYSDDVIMRKVASLLTSF